jgi:hypothetical protein
MKRLYTNPYSFDAYEVKKDSQGRGIVTAKIMKVGKLKYNTPEGKTFYGNISLEELEKAIPTARHKPVTIKHPPGMLNPSDVTKYQEGISTDNFRIEDMDGEQWLVGDYILQSDKAIETAESGKLGTSAGYFRNAVPTDVDGEFDFVNIDFNHHAIGCDNPRAEGAGLSLDEAEEDSAKVYSFAKQQKPKQKREVIMKRQLNAVKVGADFSMDEAPIEYDEAGTGTDNAISVLIDREGKLVSHMEKMQESMDNAEEAHKEREGELSGENKALKAKVEELEKEKETMISLDEVDEISNERSGIKDEIAARGIEGTFKTILEGKRMVVEHDFPDQSFDDAEIEGAYKTRNVDKKDVDERRKSREALKNADKTSMDSRKVPLSKIDPKELKKKIKN